MSCYEMLNKLHLETQHPNYVYHYAALRKLARECSNITEIGVYHLGSAFAIFLGLLENPATSKSYLGIDQFFPPEDKMKSAQSLAEQAGIAFSFLKANDMDINLEPTEMLHIDSYHTYRHLSYELEKFSSAVSTYIVMHDTSPPWGYCDENAHAPNWELESRYPMHIDRTKRGLWPAVEDFLASHPEWEVLERNTYGPGHTVLKRRGV